MRVQRYAFTALFAALLWPLIMHIAGNPLVEVLVYLPLQALALLVCLAITTILGIWVIDGMTMWSKGSSPLGGLQATLMRVGIASIATFLFCFPLRVTLSGLLNTDVSIGNVLNSQGFGVFAATLIAVQVVDILVRVYQKR